MIEKGANGSSDTLKMKLYKHGDGYEGQEISKLLDNINIGKLNTKVIIRVAVGSEYPVDPQCQHKGNFSDAFRSMLKSIELIELIEPEDIVPAYEKALNRTDGKSTILVEFADYCKTK